eukprot:jgi/Bigna1/140067/aug1.54_g14775
MSTRFTPDSAERVVENCKGRTLDLHSCSVSSEGVRALSEALAKVNPGRITSLNLFLNSLGASGAAEVKNMCTGEGGGSALRILNVRNNSFGVLGGVEMAKMISENRSLVSLNLDSNGLGPEGVEVVAEALRSNSSLTSLSLAFNRAGAVGAEKVAEALHHNKTLTALDLEGNNVKRASVSLVRSALRSSIQELLLRSNRIKLRGLMALATATEMWGGERGEGGGEEAKSSSSIMTTPTTTMTTTRQQASPTLTTDTAPVRTVTHNNDEDESKGIAKYHSMKPFFEQPSPLSWLLRVDLQYNTSGPEGHRIVVVLELLRHVRLLALSERVMSYVPEEDVLRMR